MNIVINLNLSKFRQQNFPISKSRKFKLQLSLDKNMLLNVITSKQKSTKGLIPLRVTYLGRKNKEHSKIVYVKIGAIARLLKVEKKKVENYFENNELEQKLAERLKYEPTADELKKLTKAGTGLNDKDLLDLIRICKKLKNSPEEVREEYGIELPANWEEKGAPISNQNLPLDVFIDPFGEIYILKEGDKEGAISLKGEYIPDREKTYDSIIRPLWREVKPSEKEISKLMSAETELTRIQAETLLIFASVYKDKPKALLRKLHVSIETTENIYLVKQPPLARSIFIGPDREIYIMKEGEEYEGFSVEENAIINLEKKNQPILSELRKKSKPSNDQISLLLKKETRLTRGEVVELLTFANMYRKKPKALVQNICGITKPTTEIYINKTDSNLPRSIIIDKNGEIFFLLEGHEVGKGTSKKIFLAMTKKGETYAYFSQRDSLDNITEHDLLNKIFDDISKDQNISDDCRYLLFNYAFMILPGKYKKIFAFTEYCEGGALDSKKFKEMPDKQRWEFVLNSMKGVRYFNDELNHIHNDLNPNNLLVIEKGGKKEPRWCDYGCAVEIPDVPDVPDDNIDYYLGDQAKGGTIDFQSPERIGKPLLKIKYAKRSDVFSLAATFWTLGHGQKSPSWFISFTKDCKNEIECRAKLCKKYLEIMQKDNPTQSDLGIKEPTDALELVLYKMLHPNPEKRISLDDAIKELKKAIKARWPDSDQI